MRTVSELLSQLHGLEVKLFIDGNRVGYEAPEGALTPELQDELVEHREKILELLRKAESSSKFSDPPILPVPQDAELPLSFAQQRLWFLDQLIPNSSIYNMPSAMRLTGQLDAAAFERTLGDIVRRHEVLRTTFTSMDGKPVQVISEDTSFTLPIVDLQGLPETEREAEAIRMARKEAQQPFDLAKGPLLRAKLLRLAEDDYVFLLTMHHIVSDGWSMGILHRELWTLYEAFSTGRPSPLPELPIQYADFAVWQREWLQGEALESQLTYWREHLSGAPPVLELPTDRPRPSVPQFRGAHCPLALSSTLTERLNALGQREGTTLFMTVLSAFALLLHRYTGQDDIIIGSPIANRNNIKIEGLIGFFVNTLALRTNFTDNPSFRELLGRVRETCLGAYDHQDMPFEKLVEELGSERSLSHNPVFQTLFVLQNAPGTRLELPGVEIDFIGVGSSTTKFDLTLSITEVDQELRGGLTYKTDLFNAETIARMVGHFQTILEGIVADPECPVSDLPLLTESEQQQILVKWNDTRSDYPAEQCVHELFGLQVEQTPDAVAVVFKDQQLTYRELNRRSNQLAHYLQPLGVGPEALVAVCGELSIEALVGLLAIIKAGGAYVPLEPSHPRERLNFMLRDSQASVALTQSRLLPVLRGYDGHVVCLDTDWQAISQESEENPVSAVTPRNLVYVIYTSGSTGKPKGAMIEHRSLVNHLCWIRKNLFNDQLSRLPAITQLTFDACLKQTLGILLRGGPVWILPRDIVVQPAMLLQTVCTRKQVGFNSVPSLWRAVLDVADSDEATAPVENLNSLILGGESLSKDLVSRTLSLLPHLRIWNVYGPTEATANATAAKLCLEDDVTIGRPIANTQIYILDRYLQPVPIGVPGEIHIGGVCLARGYLNRPELTAEKFIPNPFSDEPDARLYKTGDSARYLSDGNIELLGRLDNQVKIRGFRIELGEIETVLGQHQSVQEMVVTVREDRPDDKRLVAYIVPNRDQMPTVDELRRFVAKKLPKYMAPSAFILLDALPLTPHGKIDRRALPAPDRSNLGETFVAPRTPVEETISGIWAKVLHLERVGIHDNFFELGGHSLLATQVISQIRKTFQIELPLRDLFTAPNVAELAKHVENFSWATENLKTASDDMEENREKGRL